jgi:septal ring factor EnvC (AmiA/AmiB activator)
MSTGQDLERTAGLANGKLNEMVISIGPMLDEARNQHKQLQASIRNTQTALNESHQVVRGLVEKQLPVAVHDLRQISNDLAAASKDLRELKRMVTWACITMVFASLVIVANGVTVILVGKASSP